LCKISRWQLSHHITKLLRTSGAAMAAAAAAAAGCGGDANDSSAAAADADRSCRLLLLALLLVPLPWTPAHALIAVCNVEPGHTHSAWRCRMHAHAGMHAAHPTHAHLRKAARPCCCCRVL
jgi:hypothetical protein